MNWLNNVTPKFHSGQEVFVADGIKRASRVLQTYVRMVPVDYYNDGKQELLIFRGWYDLGTLTFPGSYLPPSWCHQKYIFENKDLAEVAARWYPAVFKKKIWLDAIGSRKINEGRGNIEDGCDLTIGCINDGTSEIRTWLSKCAKDGGLMEVDRKTVQSIIDECENRPDALDNPESALSQVFDKLQLTWVKQNGAS